MSKEADELYRSLFLFFLLLVLLGLFSCEPKVQIVEKEIIKEVIITDTVLVDNIVEKEVFITKEVIKDVAGQKNILLYCKGRFVRRS